MKGPPCTQTLRGSDRSTALTQGVEEWQRPAGKAGNAGGAVQLLSLLKGSDEDFPAVVLLPGATGRICTKTSYISPNPLRTHLVIIAPQASTPQSFEAIATSAQVSASAIAEVRRPSESTQVPSGRRPMPARSISASPSERVTVTGTSGTIAA